MHDGMRYVRLVRPQKSLPISVKFSMQIEIDDSMMHDCMPYDPIQCQGHGASEVPRIAFLSPPPFTSGGKLCAL